MWKVGYRKIVVGTDGSETSAIAEQAALNLARAFGAELVLLSAYEPPEVSREWAEQALARGVAAAGDRGVKATAEARAGEPAEAIMAAAEDHGADLIVVGNRGMGGARRFVLGGVPDRVSHYSPCDLLIVKTTSPDAGARPPGAYERILIATDGSPTADQAARRGADLAETVGGRITLVYVGDAAMGQIVLNHTAERLGQGDIATRVLQGDPSDRISALARDEGYDLVLVGNRGMAGARRYLLSAVPNKVSHEAHADVLIAKTVGRSITDLRPGEGAVVLLDGKQVAAYREETGEVHAVSARCTHLGCTVGWNDGAKTWDCPCHGSRYDHTGKVIQGPAERDLAPHQVSS
jgi:nucleotide-binding universal stress UspA family protein